MQHGGDARGLSLSRGARAAPRAEGRAPGRRAASPGRRWSRPGDRRGRGSWTGGVSQKATSAVPSALVMLPRPPSPACAAASNAAPSAVASVALAAGGEGEHQRRTRRRAARVVVVGAGPGSARVSGARRERLGKERDQLALERGRGERHYSAFRTEVSSGKLGGGLGGKGGLVGPVPLPCLCFSNTLTKALVASS